MPTQDELSRIFGAAELEHVHEVLDGLRRRGILTVRPEDGRLLVAVEGYGANSSTLPSPGPEGEPDEDRWKLISETRRALLAQGARLAAMRASGQSLEKLEHALRSKVAQRSAGPVEVLESDGDFEREVIIASGNDLMLRVYDRLVILEGLTHSEASVQDARTEDESIAFARRELLTAIAARQTQAAALLADRVL